MFCQADSVGMLCLLRPCNYKSEMVGWTIQALPTGHCLKATKNGSSTAIKISSTVAEAFSLLRRCDSDRQAAIAKLCLFNIWTECPSWDPYLPSSLVWCVCSQGMVCAHCSLHYKPKDKLKLVATSASSLCLHSSAAFWSLQLLVWMISWFARITGSAVAVTAMAMSQITFKYPLYS